MNNFKRTIMPGFLPDGPRGGLVPMHITIELKSGNLSITGVVGARANGDCWGSCGQCIDELMRGDFVLADGWTRADIEKLHKVWENWHLNDMRPACQHQIEAGWLENAKEQVTIYHWRLTTEAMKASSAAEKTAVAALKAGETFTPTKEQTFMASLPFLLKTYTETLDPSIATYYKPKNPLYAGSSGHTETKTLGWLKQEQHPDGILCKPCPVCGYKYGTAWLKEEIPQDIIDYLVTLPTAEKHCAWGAA